jgi:hypothetical protein
MNLGQTMLTAGMLMLLVMSVISANRMIIDNTAAQFQSEALVSSATIANDLLLEIMNKRFDGKPDSTRLVNGLCAISEFSPYDSTHVQVEWGPAKAEKDSIQYWPDRQITEPTDTVPHFLSKKWFNDIDDYDGYQRTVDYGNIKGFIVNVKVYYVTATSPDIRTLSRTNFKKVEVTVSHPQYLTVEVTPEGIIIRNTAVYSALASY